MASQVAWLVRTRLGALLRGQADKSVKRLQRKKILISPQLYSGALSISKPQVSGDTIRMLAP